MHCQIRQPGAVPRDALHPAAGHRDLTTARTRVCTEALSWLGTPYHHHARIKGQGVDCVHLLCGVYEACGLLPPTDPGWYAQTWHLSRSEELYANGLDERMQRTTSPEAGDVVLWKYGRTHSHAGILLADGHVIHARWQRGGGSVVVSDLRHGAMASRDPWYWSIEKLIPEA